MIFYEPTTSVLFITTASWSTPFPIARSWSFPSFSASTSSITPSGRFVFLSPVVVRIWAAPTHYYKEKSRQLCYKLQDVNAAAMLDFTNDRTDSWVFGFVTRPQPPHDATTKLRSLPTTQWTHHTVHVPEYTCHIVHLLHRGPTTEHPYPTQHPSHSAPTTEYTYHRVHLQRRVPTI